MRLTDHDASFLYGETASGPMHGATVSVLKGELTHQQIFDHLKGRMHLVPRFRERLAFVPMNIAHPKWVPDPYFDIANHVVSHHVSPGTSVDEAIQIGVDLAEPLLPRDRPLWKFVVIEGVPGHTFLVQMAHHAMIDGVSGVDVSEILTDLSPEAEQPPPPSEPFSPPPMPSPLELWNEALRENADAAQAQLRRGLPDGEVQQMLQRGQEAMSRFLTQPVVTAPWNAGLVGPKRKVAWTKYTFAEFRQVRRALGGTINDIVLTVVVEAAARYLAHHNEATRDRYLRLMCPVSVRREGEAGELGNRVSAMFPILPAWPMDIEERLIGVCEETATLKGNQEPQALELMQEMNGGTPPMTMAQTLLVGTPFDPTAFAAQNPPPVMPPFGPRPPLIGFNFTCTNVPGVQVPQYIAGAEVIDPIGTLMLSGTLGFGVAVGSYDQRLYFNLVSDPRLLPDLDRMLAGIKDSFAELVAVATSRSAA